MKPPCGTPNFPHGSSLAAARTYVLWTLMRPFFIHLRCQQEPSNANHLAHHSLLAGAFSVPTRGRKGGPRQNICTVQSDGSAKQELRQPRSSRVTVASSARCQKRHRDALADGKLAVSREFHSHGRTPRAKSDEQGRMRLGEPWPEWSLNEWWENACLPPQTLLLLVCLAYFIIYQVQAPCTSGASPRQADARLRLRACQ